jgi:DtxR family transcriptional regulator, Mn-dependent transcriptional regulator
MLLTMMHEANTAQAMSSPLEDYLETIYLLVQEHGFARVRDIAQARGVAAATVSVALRKLAEGEFVNYEPRAYIGLTAKGEDAARRILSRHRLLTRFFEEVLKMPAAAAAEQACSMEHTLTDEAMDRIVRFFEFLGRCPSVVHAFSKCPVAMGSSAASESGPAATCATCAIRGEVKTMSLADLEPGRSGVVTQIAATGALRQRLLDMGVLPETRVDLERVGLGGDPMWIRCQGARLAVRRSEASTILIRHDPDVRVLPAVTR